MNKVQLLGRLTKDPELRYAGNNNTAIVRLTLAVDRRFTKDGEGKQADFLNLVAFGKTAEFISKYFTKGQQMAVAGRIQTGSYEKDGQKRYTFDIMVEDVYFAGNKNASSSGSSKVQSSTNKKSSSVKVKEESSKEKEEEAIPFENNFVPDESSFEAYEDDDDLPF